MGTLKVLIFFFTLIFNVLGKELVEQNAWFLKTQKREVRNFTVVNIYKGVSELQCLHHCSRYKDCVKSSYGKYDKEQLGECILLKIASEESEEIFEFDDLSGSMNYDTLKAHAYDDCKHAFEDFQRKSGNKFLKKPLGWHYCEMETLGECGDGGWTLAMTVDGTKPTFNYQSKYWTNKMAYNDRKALTSPLTIESKYNAFSMLPFEYICIAMKIGSTTRYVKVDMSNPVERHTLVSLFAKDEPTILTDDMINPSAWMKLLPAPLPDKTKCRQGFNLDAETAGQLRLGLFMNEDLCQRNWVDVWIGVGGDVLYCTDKYEHLTAGSHCCLVACKDKGTFAMTYLFIK